MRQGILFILFLMFSISLSAENPGWISGTAYKTENLKEDSLGDPVFLTISEGVDFQGARGDHHGHFEAGTGGGLAYLVNEKTWAPAFHFHFLKAFGKNDLLWTGPGVEIVFDEHFHAGIFISFIYQAFHSFSFGLSPGISVFQSEESHKLQAGFSTHLEMLYEIEAGNIHFGPLAEFSIMKSDPHFLLGIHIGFPIKHGGHP